MNNMLEKQVSLTESLKNLELVDSINTPLISFDNSSNLSVNEVFSPNEMFANALPLDQTFSTFDAENINFDFLDNSEDTETDEDPYFTMYDNDQTLSATMIVNTFVNYGSCITNILKELFIIQFKENLFFKSLLLVTGIVTAGSFIVDPQLTYAMILAASIPLILGSYNVWKRFKKIY